MRRLGAAATLLLAAACVVNAPRREERGGHNTTPVRDEGGRTVRVAVAAAPSGSVGGAGGSWRLYGANGRSTLVRGMVNEPWTVERRGAQLRAVRRDGVPTPFTDGPLLVRPIDMGALVTWNGRRYRGELAITATDSGLLVVNRLPVESYLRGVVPLEIGERTPAERAAVEAQAIAARSYAYVRLGGSVARPFDLQATVADQVYGGADAERPLADEAIRSTHGLVITYAGRVVNAPYHSTCGGSTAEVSDVWWRQRGEPYLRRVSDRVPGTSRYYCDVSPKFAWTRTFTGPALATLLARYLGQYAALPSGGTGAVRAVGAQGATPSGRVAALRVATERGAYELRGNDIRFVLRSSGGEILPSTYFTVESAHVGRDGWLSELTLRGGGNGHGIGMCQWGAIGRARAGYDHRAILSAYYPGTRVAAVD